MKTFYHSYKLKSLPKGCKLCIKGKKTVIFITGICPRKCFYCPLSEKKNRHDVIYANELPLKEDSDSKNIKQLIKEAKSHNSKGAGITGGDPLSRLPRTLQYIKALKKEFGKKYHIHLYTSLNLVTPETLKKLHDSGLDEIRFHLDFNKLYWNKLESIKDFDWDVGVEIPVLPDKLKEAKEMVDFIHDKVDFLNLNEFEYSDNGGDFSKYQTLSPETYAIKNSLVVGLKILDYIKSQKYKLKAHLCTAKLKDAVQLKNRLKRKAKTQKLPCDKVTKDGLLLRNCVYLKDNSPRNKSLEKIKSDTPKFIKMLKTCSKKKGLDKYHLDEELCRIIVPKKAFKKELIDLSDCLDFCIVEEYPTHDHFITEIDFLN